VHITGGLTICPQMNLASSVSFNGGSHSIGVFTASGSVSFDGNPFFIGTTLTLNQDATVLSGGVSLMRSNLYSIGSLLFPTSTSIISLKNSYITSRSTIILQNGGGFSSQDSVSRLESFNTMIINSTGVVLIPIVNHGTVSIINTMVVFPSYTQTIGSTLFLDGATLNCQTPLNITNGGIKSLSGTIVTPQLTFSSLD
jgi:hypothetical protein